MVRIGVGQCLVGLGRVAEGIAQLENVMLSVIAGRGKPDRLRHRLLLGDRCVQPSIRPETRR